MAAAALLGPRPLSPSPPPCIGKRETEMSQAEAAEAKKFKRGKNNIAAKKCRDSNKRRAMADEMVVDTLERINPVLEQRVRYIFQVKDN